MSIIKAGCPQCGEVRLSADSVSLLVHMTASRSQYSFICPSCAQVVRKAASSHVVSLLIAGGVSATDWDIPGEALETHDGPVLGYDDLLDFCLRLRGPDDLATLAAPAIPG